MIVDIEQKKKELLISVVGKKGNIEFLTIPLPQEEQFEWEVTHPGDKRAEKEIFSWENKPVRKRKTNYLNRYRIEEILLNQPEEIREKLNAYYVPKMFFCDIEVEITDDGFPHPHLAKNQITTIAFCRGTKLYVLATKKLSPEQIQNINKKINDYFKNFYNSIEFVFLYFPSEYDMLYSFVMKAIQKMPLITGWNFVDFDWCYIVNRCRRLGIDPRHCSPTKKLYGKKELPAHKIVVDYLDVYKKWDRTIDVKENNSLDFVSKAVLGINKIKYSGSLQDLYEQDFEQYIFYNAVDTLLVQLIHEKLKTMQTFLSLATIAGVEVQRAFSPIWMTEINMVREFYKRKKVIPATKNENKKREQYEGAYVFQPEPGIYSYVASFDFASLYPSIMRQWNISPEGYLGNSKERIKPGEGKIQTSSGAIFDNTQDSVFRTILTNFYNKRRQAKNEMFEIEKEIDILKKYINSR